ANSISDASIMNTELLQKNEELEKKLANANLKIENFVDNQKWIESQLIEEQNSKLEIESENKLLSRKLLNIENQLAAERKAAENNREQWSTKEKQLESDLKQARNNINMVRRNTVSIGSRPRNLSTRGQPNAHDANASKTNNRLSVYYENIPEKSLSPTKFPDALGANSSLDVFETFPNTPDGLSQLNSLKKSLREREREISSLKSEIFGLNNDLRSSLERVQQSNASIEKYKNEIRECKQLIDTLRDENESYQTLIQMQSISGNFNLKSYEDNHSNTNSNSPKSKYSYDKSNAPSPYDDDAEFLSQLDVPNTRLRSRQNSTLAQSASLGMQLSGHSNTPQTEPQPSYSVEIVELKEKNRILKAEKAKLVDENKATALYINQILSRILASSNGLEAILDKDFDISSEKKSKNMVLEPTSKSSKSIDNHDNNKNASKTASFDTEQSKPNPDQNSSTTAKNTEGNENSILGIFGSAIRRNSLIKKFETPTSTKEEKPDDITTKETSVGPSEELAENTQVRPRRNTKSKNSARPTWWNRLSQRFVFDEKDEIVPSMPPEHILKEYQEKLSYYSFIPLSVWGTIKTGLCFMEVSIHTKAHKKITAKVHNMDAIHKSTWLL
ncbi:hypothetical protein BB560_003717, partial [Smittium megazygosporum]